MESILQKLGILAQSLRTTVRHRYGRTLPWVSGGAGVFLFGMVAAFGTVQDAEAPISQRAVLEPLPITVNFESTPAVGEFWSEERFSRGDTFAALLSRLGVNSAEFDLLRRSSLSKSPLRGLNPGTTVQAKVNGNGELQSLWYVVGRDRVVTLNREGDDFRASEQPAQVTRREVMKSGEIRSSLFAATDAADIPDNVAGQIADIFAGDVDFHRDLRRGDRFSVIYETYDFNGRETRSGRVLAAEFVNQNRVFRAMWYPDPETGLEKDGSYYTPEGKNLRKAFLRSPLEFSRVSSGFGMRMHPIQQSWRAHTGVDYAAPSGTRIRATGDGVIDSIGGQGGYGNVVVLRHNSGITTWYAHMSSFARGMTRGTRVSQGDVIGYVGQTGWATGPHLHYEFRINDRHRNPLTIALPASQPIPAGKLPKFLAYAEPYTARIELLRNSNLALLD
ncbi:MAG: peptidoglycan DD-metalloendopeptidase family protein [Burkholderiales bacterium]